MYAGKADLTGQSGDRSHTEGGIGHIYVVCVIGVDDSLPWPGTPEGDLSRKVSNRAGLLFALVSLECSVEGGAVDVEHLGEVVEVHAGVE